VSDQPYESVRPYLLPGLGVFVGAEGLVPSGMGEGAVGSVSGLASVFPEPVVAMVRDPSEETAAPVQALRRGLERFPFVPAAKRALGRRGIDVKEDLRAPFLPLSAEQAAEVDRIVDEWLASR
jgi:dihydrodipicolinate synthase/N-acetylneuraminate lyase